MRKYRHRESFRPDFGALEVRRLLSAAILYVDGNIAADSKSNVHDGSSWAKAFGSLQDALTKAAATPQGEQIWIAQGTYYPSRIYSPLDAGGHPVAGGAFGTAVQNLKTFDLPNNVSLYGGLTYGMRSLSQADPVANPTILSGDLGGNDINDPSAPGYAASKADNAWHVVTLGDDVTQRGVTATLDGLQIIDGYANGGDVGGTLSPFILGHSDGGGVYAAWGSSVTVNDDLFRYNFAASDGGGLFGNTSNIVATNSQFLQNSALVRAGGLEGLNDFEGGASHTSVLVNDFFQGNTCAVFGGAVVGEGADQGPDSLMSISGCTFVNNQAAEGGAVTFDTLTIKIDGSTFLGNVATVDGGALATTNVVGTIVGAPNAFATTVTNSTFTGNVAEDDHAAHVTLNGFTGSPAWTSPAGGAPSRLTSMDTSTSTATCSPRTGPSTATAGRSSTATRPPTCPGSRPSRSRPGSAIASSSATRRPMAMAAPIASETDGLSPGSTVNATVLSVTGSAFAANQAAGSGGAIYLGGSTATIASDVFVLDSAAAGSGIAAKSSQVDGYTSSDPRARAALQSLNSFLIDGLSLS